MASLLSGLLLASGLFFIITASWPKSPRVILPTKLADEVVLGAPSLQATPIGSALPSHRSSHSTSPIIRSANPLAGWTFYSWSGSQASAQLSSLPPDQATQIKVIADQPQAIWLGSWVGDVSGLVASTSRAAAGQHRLPVYAIYAIPGLNCSSDGLAAASYRSFIDQIAVAAANRPAVFILEPDALAELSCWDSPTQKQNLGLLSYALDRLKSNPAARVYIDGGTSRWQPAGVMAERLRSAGVGRANGFSLNVSNFISTSETASYGNQISQLLGGSHFVIDTSRNGHGPAPGDDVCNPPGRALGTHPTSATGQALVDAYLWIKAPGESDGTCHNGPAAGVWWLDYALDLVANSH